MRAFGILACIAIALHSLSAPAAEVPSARVLKGGTQYESALRAAGVPISNGLSYAR